MESRERCLRLIREKIRVTSFELVKLISCWEGVIKLIYATKGSIEALPARMARDIVLSIRLMKFRGAYLSKAVLDDPASIMKLVEEVWDHGGLNWGFNEETLLEMMPEDTREEVLKRAAEPEESLNAFLQRGQIIRSGIEFMEQFLGNLVQQRPDLEGVITAPSTSEDHERIKEIAQRPESIAPGMKEPMPFMATRDQTLIMLTAIESEMAGMLKRLREVIELYQFVISNMIDGPEGRPKTTEMQKAYINRFIEVFQNLELFKDEMDLVDDKGKLLAETRILSAIGFFPRALDLFTKLEKEDPAELETIRVRNRDEILVGKAYLESLLV